MRPADEISIAGPMAGGAFPNAYRLIQAFGQEPAFEASSVCSYRACQKNARYDDFENQALQRSSSSIAVGLSQSFTIGYVFHRLDSKTDLPNGRTIMIRNAEVSGIMKYQDIAVLE